VTGKNVMRNRTIFPGAVIMSKYWSGNIALIEPYVPGEQPKDRRFIKLNTNENPYPPSPSVIRAVKKAANGNLRLYPDPECNELRKVISGYYKIDKDEVFIGNGSDEVLAFSFAAYFDNGKPVLFPDITYSFYPVYSQFFKLKYETVCLSQDFSIPVEKFLADNGGIIIPNPNAPTSKYLPIDGIKKILDYNLSIDKVVIIDEAYIDFGGQSAVGLIGSYPNLIVIQTLSKSRSLAGLRIGFAMGNRELIEGLNRVKSSINSYTVDRLAEAGAVAAFRDDRYFRMTSARIVKTRDRVSKKLRSAGFDTVESNANFIFISHPDMHAGEIYRRLKENGILVRYFNKPRIDNFLRVSIGTDKEMDVFVDAVCRIINRHSSG
jgi:histidinol-phosphate aminotransferase